MNRPYREDILQESQAMLRMVKAAATDEIYLATARRAEGEIPAADHATRPGATGLSGVLDQAAREIDRAVAQLREDCSRLQHATATRLRGGAPPAPQLPDGTARQLSQASSLLREIDDRLCELTTLFDPHAPGTAAAG